MSVAQRGLPFLIEGDAQVNSDEDDFTGFTESVTFRPEYIPQRIKLSKERNLSRKANFCGLEDVFEIHGKNREIHLSGYILRSELSDFSDVLNWNKEATLVTPGLPDGLRIRISKGDREGPVSWDPQHQEYQWKYSLDVVSTGESEARHISKYNEGIINDEIEYDSIYDRYGGAYDDPQDWDSEIGGDENDIYDEYGGT